MINDKIDYEKLLKREQGVVNKTRLLDKIMIEVLEQREEILLAFVAKYGNLDPGKIEQVFGEDENGNITYYVRERK